MVLCDGHRRPWEQTQWSRITSVVGSQAPGLASLWFSSALRHSSLQVKVSVLQRVCLFKTNPLSHCTRLTATVLQHNVRLAILWFQSFVLSSGPFYFTPQPVSSRFCGPQFVCSLLACSSCHDSVTLKLFTLY